MRGYIYSRKSKRGTRYYAKYDAGRDPVTGKRRQFNGYAGATKKEAEAFLNAKLSEINRGAVTSPKAGKITVGAYFREWLPNHPVRASTRAGYMDKFQTYIEPILGNIPLIALSADDVVRMHNVMKAKGLSDTTIHHAHALLHTALAVAMRRDLLLRNVAGFVRAPKLGKRRVEIPGPEVLTAIFDRLRRYRLYPAYVTMRNTGMRREELVGLQWRWVDLDAGELRVEQVLTYSDKNHTYNSLKCEAPKTERSRRTVPLADEVVAVLREWRVRQAAERAAACDAYEDHDLVFCKSDGRFLAPDQLTREFKAALKDLQGAGVAIPKDWCLYVLRHLLGSALVAEGEDVVVVSTLLGHNSPRFTLDTYASHRPETAPREMIQRHAGRTRHHSA